MDMLNNSQQKIIDAFFILMKQLAKSLIRSGMGYREFSEIAKSAFVSVATDEYGVRGRPTNVSRVAAMTGLTRREVKRLRTKSSEGRPSQIEKPIPPSMVMHAWQTHPDYLNSDGTPIFLSFADSGISFSSLVKQVGGDVPPGAMRTELVRLGCISENEDGLLQIEKPYVLTPNMDERLANSVAAQLQLHASTIVHNTHSDNQSDLRTENIVYTTRMQTIDKDRFRRVACNQLEDLVNNVSEIVNSYETMKDLEGDENSGGQFTVGVGVFYFEEKHDFRPNRTDN